MDNCQSGRNNAKYLINSIETNIRDHLIGLARTNQSLQYVSSCDAIIRKDIGQLCANGQVLLISGGGAGHEPMFAGFVGHNQLTAAISGSYFASPSSGSIIRLFEQIVPNKQASILLIQANYTGDRLNFGLANEYLQSHGYQNVQCFIFGDDLVPLLMDRNDADYRNLRNKRRGLAGILFVHRIAGILAERGKNLIEISEYLNRISNLIFTYSISLSSADIIGHGRSFQLKANEIEIGLGVHGESGIRKHRLLSATETVELILAEMIGYLDQNGILDKYQRKVVVLINNLGGLITMEMNIIKNEIIQQLMTDYRVEIERVYAGTHFTSFNMKGFSLTLFIIDNDDIIDILDEFDSENRDSYQVNHDYMFNSNKSFELSTEINSNDRFKQFFIRQICTTNVYNDCLMNACQTIIKYEFELNRLDETVGDSDCGSTLSSIAKLILQQMNSGDELQSFDKLSKLLINSQIGGTSGAIYSILFTSANNFLINQFDSDINIDNNNDNNNRLLLIKNFWLNLLEYCSSKISYYGGANIGDRSMIDGLNGIIIGLKKISVDHDRNVDYDVNDMIKQLMIIAESTWFQAKSTSKMVAKVGRASMVNRQLIVRPDSGAIAIAIWSQAIIDVLINRLIEKNAEQLFDYETMNSIGKQMKEIFN